MNVLITIAGVDYDDVGRPGAALEINSLHRTLEGYDELAFARHGGAPTPDWPNGTPVVLKLDGTVWFKGQITHEQHAQDQYGWSIGYNAQGLKFVVDRVAFTAPDGTGNYTYNRSPEDPYYVAAEAGLTLGQIITDILLVQSNATALSAAGIVYASTTPPILHATTVADLALLNVVPPRPVTVAGPNLFNWIDQTVQRWMPTWVCEVLPTGIVRFKDTHNLTTFVPRTITLPGIGGPGDDVEWPTMSRTSDQCYTRLVLRGGPNVSSALLSELDGTLVKAWTSGQQSAWTLHDFTDPKDASSVGAVSSVTSTSVTFDPDDGAASWSANFWPGRQAWIWLLNPVATGITPFEVRRITSNTACAALGTCTITWDASQPITATNYTRARIVGGAGGNADVSRLYTVREPATGATGLSTYIGAHLVVRNPLPIRWANNTQSIDLFYATGTIWNSAAGPSIPWNVSAIPSTGQFRFSQPAVSAFGNPTTLNSGYPATTANGLPYDVQVLALYSLGALSVTVPPDVGGSPTYQGSAYTQDGIALTKTEDVPEWIDGTGVGPMTTLAQKLLDSYSDTVVEGSFEHYDVPAWDFLTFGTAVNFAIAGGTSPWTAINAPIKSVQLDWGQNPQGWQFKVTFGFSTRRRPFSGSDLYIHPAFRHGSVLGEVLQGGGLALEDMGIVVPRFDTSSIAGLREMGAASAPAGGMNIGSLLDQLGPAGGLMDRLDQTRTPDMSGALGAADTAGTRGAADMGAFLAGQGLAPDLSYQGPGLASNEEFARGMRNVNGPQEPVDPEFAAAMAQGRRGQEAKSVEGTGWRGGDQAFREELGIQKEARLETDEANRDQAESARRLARRHEQEQAQQRSGQTTREMMGRMQAPELAAPTVSMPRSPGPLADTVVQPPPPLPPSQRPDFNDRPDLLGDYQGGTQVASAGGGNQGGLAGGLTAFVAMASMGATGMARHQSDRRPQQAAPPPEPPRSPPMRAPDPNHPDLVGPPAPAGYGSSAIVQAGPPAIAAGTGGGLGAPEGGLDTFGD